MKRDLGSTEETEAAESQQQQGEATDSAAELRHDDVGNGPVPIGQSAGMAVDTARSRVSQCNGNYNIDGSNLVVYTRNKRLKRASKPVFDGLTANSSELRGEGNGITANGEGIILEKSEGERMAIKEELLNGDSVTSASEVLGSDGSVVVKGNLKVSSSGGSSSNGGVVNNEEEKGNSVISANNSDVNLLVEGNGGSVRMDSWILSLSANGNAANKEKLKGKNEMVEVEVKLAQDDAMMMKRFTRSSLKVKSDTDKDVGMEMEALDNGTVEVSNDTPVDVATATDATEMMEVETRENMDVKTAETPTKKMEMKMSKKIEITARPTNVKELFETGLLEGYPVFHSGGSKGIPLRGTITDTGILCSCALCRGSRVIPPSQFEIHATKTYKRASQYICLENGKSLLDVVKECRKGSLKSLEETIQSFIGPLPEKESTTCLNCGGSYLATPAAKLDQLCDSCLVVIRSEASPANVVTTTQPKRRGRKKRKSLEVSDAKSPGRSSVRISVRKKSHWKALNKLSKPDYVSDSTESSSMRRPLKKKKILKKICQTTLVPKISKSSYKCNSAQSKSQSKITKKDIRMHKMVFEEGGLPDGTEVAYYARGKKMLVGYKRGTGIYCTCCSNEVSPSQFEAHAGWASRKKPYGYIYTSNGVSLHEFAVSLCKGRKSSAKENDDLCSICADGGKLVLCDGCPRSFHKECSSLQSIPRGKWYCNYCQNMFQREKFVEHNANAVAAGRLPGIDPIEQITNRCIRIVKNPEEAEVIACVICRAYDFSKTGFGPRTVIVCDQCEKEYHVGCLKKQKIADLKALPKGKWFCSTDCQRIDAALQNLLNSGEEKLPDSCLDVMKKKHKKNGIVEGTDFDVRWRLLSGKIASRETRVLLSEAVAIFHGCFDPIVDAATGRDFIPSLVYGRNIRGQDFSGMYCAILTVNSSIVSAGILRIFGPDMAELPLVATRTGNQGKGYFQLLFSCIEKLLSFLNVKSCVLPAADEAVSIWMDKFGFQKILPEQLINYRKTCWQMITFKGTAMLEKQVPRCRIICPDEANSDVPMKEEDEVVY